MSHGTSSGNIATEQRKLAAIMFTDMVGYSALSQRDSKLIPNGLLLYTPIARCG